jgi:tRNA nucleotidyltransferase/poly(A) polymerase
MPNLLDLFCKYAASSGISNSSFIVGGTVRDLILNKEIKDVDIAFNGDAVSIARAFSDETGATFILLDENFGIARIALFNEYLDICSMRGASITDDLGDRDLTINAMAVPLSVYGIEGTGVGRQELKAVIIDPFNGMGDIEHGVIRMVSRENLASDPLRLLRVYRFAATLSFSIDKATTAAVHSLHALISASAPERVAEELRHILRNSASAATLKDMQSSGLLLSLFPELAGNSQETWHDVWSAYDNAEYILAHLTDYFVDRSDPVGKYFKTGYKSDCLKLSIMFGYVRSAESVAGRLRLSRKETEYIRMVFAYHEILSSLDGARRSIVIGLLRELGDNIYAILVYILALSKTFMTSDMPQLSMAREIIAIYQDEYLPRMRRLPLITGHDLIEEFSLSPSPFFSDILSAIELLALEGTLNSREEALRAAGDMIKNKGGMG